MNQKIYSSKVIDLNSKTIMKEKDINNLHKCKYKLFMEVASLKNEINKIDLGLIKKRERTLSGAKY